MKITELNAQFIKLTCLHKPEFRFHKEDGTAYTLAESDGIWFNCPVCYKAMGNAIVGVHSILCWRPHVPQSQNPAPGRWEFVGTSLDDLTLTAAASSILLPGAGCGAHFYIRNGEIA